MKTNLRVLLSTVFCLIFYTGCNETKDLIEDAIDGNQVRRKPISKEIIGVNAYANNSKFGSPSSQYHEVKNKLGLKFVRVLMNWDNGASPSPTAPLNFSFYDKLVNSVPSGVEVLIVTTEAPRWMNNPSNWVDNDPRKTFVEKWLKPLVSRYASNPKVSAIQVWNEPNFSTLSENKLMQFVDKPENYAQMFTLSAKTIKDIAPRIKVVNAATTSINQNFPSTLNYNKDMANAGVADATDIYAIHYYGEQFERVGSIKNFLNRDISKPIWVTESGEQGVNNQLRYVERAWPFLKEKIPGIQRFYYYQFTEATSPEKTYGLKNLSKDNPVSDLYIWLRDN